MDHLNKKERSLNMSRIRSKDTIPEKTVRSMLHQMGYRFRLNRKDLPGKPDIVLPKYKTLVFVHGCFWHRHEKCADATTPKSRIEFWLTKFQANVERDKKNQKTLTALGWTIIIVWECELRAKELLNKKLSAILSKAKKTSNKNRPLFIHPKNGY